ncbi:trypsin-like peptidase domain-containing protein [Polaribacter sp. R2A056_3_33]|uniref:trypsin-like peptidase domain-containing protein n=1 Tax=Polaribacter sp. R2A056_3_33 TaxID=2745563 RepID=UPI001C4F4EBF|nr:trypsin-like peptidase domain-containing protein [Polaribacter sp. R2A056_3_33]QXP70480.1 trypsin-like peptidase domain-containing protein [Polaribacter sp. R2A056_3_33]
MKKLLSLLGMAVLGGAITLGGYKMLFNENVVIERTISHPVKTVTANYNPALSNANAIANSVDFTVAAENTVHAVVHVKNTSIRTQSNPIDLFFGNSSGTRKFEQVGTGSGVIISQDGYIVSNNHVVDGASDIEITLNNKQKYKATLIGTDKENDIALLKIDVDFDLPYIPFANSDNIKIGEWVLAVGNPYNLTSTVTAGIVSAKGRDLEGTTSTDSFIQTDAAVNPGNSGGALVNTRGELVGINTAITSKTGSFIGYSFAVPSNIAKKIIDDLLEFGTVQEAILGININQEDGDIEGVLIGGVSDDGGAQKGGLKAGDVIKKVNDVKISKFSELRGQLTAKRPGDLVNITIDRDGEEITKSITLSKKDAYVSRKLGVVLKDVSKKEIKKFDISGGARIITNQNKNLNYYGVKEGYIITKINKKPVLNASDAVKEIDASFGAGHPIYIEVINLDGERERYAFR